MNVYKIWNATTNRYIVAGDDEGSHWYSYRRDVAEEFLEDLQLMYPEMTYELRLT